MQINTKTVVIRQSSVTVTLSSREAVLLACIIGDNCLEDNEEAIRKYIKRSDYKKALGPMEISISQDDRIFGEGLYDELDKAIKALPDPLEE